MPAIGEAVAICEGVWWGRLPLPDPAGHVNVYVLRDTRGWVLIDAGCRSSECRRALASLLRGIGLRFADLRQLILTHHHPDHFGLASELQQRGVELVASEACLHAARARYQSPSPRPRANDVEAARRAGLTGVHLEAYRRGSPARFPTPELPDAEACRTAHHGDTLAIDGRRWLVQLGEGHAAGHLTLWSDDGLAVTGDHFLLGITTNLSRAQPLAGDPVAAFEETSEAMLRQATDETLILPGHNQPFTGVQDRWRQIRASRQSLINRLLDALSQPRTALDCLAAVHRRELTPYEKPILLADCLVHLDHMANQGVVEELRQTCGAALWRRVPTNS